MLKHWIFAALSVATAVGVAAIPSAAQGPAAQTNYVYVSQFSVPRSMWADMEKEQTTYRGVCDKLIADGTADSCGEAVNLVHQEGEPTHGFWIGANTRAGIVHGIAALTALPSSTSPVLNASKHWDLFLESSADEDGRKAGTFTNAYLQVLALQLKNGQEENFDHLYKTYILPVYKELMTDGTLIYYSVQGQAILTSAPGLLQIVTIYPNAEALDKENAAFQALWAKNPAAFQALVATAKNKTVRSFLYLVPYVKSK